MRRIIALIFFLSFLVILIKTPSVWAQNLPFKDTAQIIFGNGAQVIPGPGPGGGGGSGDDLPAGVFRPPFKCDLSYVGSTYPAHSPYSVDFNRAPFGASDRGDPVRAEANGKVVGYLVPCGQITIAHKGGYASVYVHMRHITVGVGDIVKLGQQIGEISDTSDPVIGCRATGPHLHVNQMLNKKNIKVGFDTNNDNVNEPYPMSLYHAPSIMRSDKRVTGLCP